MVSTFTALYVVAAVFGTIGAAVVGDKLGRKWTLIQYLGTLLFS